MTTWMGLSQRFSGDVGVMWECSGEVGFCCDVGVVVK